MKHQLMDAFNHPSKKNCYYSFNVERTASDKLNALDYFDWTPEPSRDIPDYTTCIFPLGLGCPEVYTSDGVIWADPIFGEDEVNFVLDLPDVWSGYTGKILNNIKQMAETLPEGEKIREPDIQSPLGVAEIVCGQGLYIAPHLCKDVHKCPETKAWGTFEDEAAMLEYILDGMQGNTSMHFWFGGYEKHPDAAEKLYAVLNERGYTPASQGY